MVLYVDDIMLIGNDVELLSLVKIQLSTFFQMKNLGETQDILGIKFLRDCKNRKSLLSQTTYIDKILIKQAMQDSKKGLLSLKYEIPYSRDHCTKTPKEKERIQVVLYVSIVGSLMYAMLCTRLGYLLCSKYDEQISIKSRPRTLDNC